MYATNACAGFSEAAEGRAGATLMLSAVRSLTAEERSSDSQPSAPKRTTFPELLFRLNPPPVNPRMDSPTPNSEAYDPGHYPYHTQAHETVARLLERHKHGSCPCDKQHSTAD